MAEEPRRQKGVVEEFKELTEAKIAVRDSGFPRLTIKGGPHGRAAAIEIDGVKIPGNTRTTIVINPTDAVRVITEQIVELDVNVELLTNADKGPAWHVIVRDVTHVDRINPQWKLAEATADTPWEALIDCAKQLELAAKSDTGVAQAGTMKESSGRPPGH